MRARQSRDQAADRGLDFDRRIGLDSAGHGSVSGPGALLDPQDSLRLARARGKSGVVAVGQPAVEIGRRRIGADRHVDRLCGGGAIELGRGAPC